MKHLCIAILTLTVLTAMVVAESDTSEKAKSRKKKKAKIANAASSEKKLDKNPAAPPTKKKNKKKVPPTAKPAAGAMSPANPYVSSQPLRANNPIDIILLAEFKAQGITPAKLCSDPVFCRRVYIDLTGTLPPPRAVAAFLNDKAPDKRAKLIDVLLNRREAHTYWTLKWCDHLRVKSEFPINLWPNAVAAYHQWILQAVTNDMGYDKFARALLTSSGSNFRVAPVNFYRAMQQRTPEGIAQVVAGTFLGSDITAWPEASQARLANVFAKVRYKSTVEWKEQIIFNDPTPNTPGVLVMPDGSRVTMTAFDDRRQLFADWLISPKNPWFARAAVNRLWVWMLGRGLIDDLAPGTKIKSSASAKLLNTLAAEFARAKYSQRHILRMIANSAIYQQASIPADHSAKAKATFASYPIRRLDAEVLIDAINYVIVGHEKYFSIVPEPFTFIPIQNRTIALADGSITSPFLEMFGRPARDTGLLTERNNNPTTNQLLHMLNSTDIQFKLTKSSRINFIMRNTKLSVPQRVSQLYLLILSRYPTPAEAKTSLEFLTKRRFKKGRSGEYAFRDLAWALLNNTEFLYRH
ncbi:MAG: DUF1553 domain-containing protein [Phycisphaerales bacterium]|jgi:hypothetical protein|nr:DUF1553 domain-containing protein [Phycisphaerales bacterium]MBT7170175.1 DUF1553 domain-containing protein [Phycisphaerales bacterium]